MIKAFIFVFGGTAVIYYFCFGSNYKLKLPGIADVKSQYEIKKIHNENIDLKIKLQKAEFSLARLQESSVVKSANREIASDVKKSYEIFPPDRQIQDYVKQDVYHWSEGKLLALSEKEYKLKNYLAAAQYGMTLVNLNSEINVDEKFLYRLGISCIESKMYLNEGIYVLGDLIKKHPESPLVIQAKLWRGLAFHRLNNKEEFIAMMEEFKTKYRNSKEWNVLKSIYDRSLASTPKNHLEKDKKGNKNNQDGDHE